MASFNAISTLPRTMKIRASALAFLLAELSDFLTTYAGMRLGFLEGNRLDWPTLVTAKLAATVAFAVMLNFKPRSRLDWLYPVVAALPVVWNLAMIGGA